MNPKLVAPLAILMFAAIGAFILVSTAPSIEYAEPERAIPTVRVIDASVQTLRHSVRTQGTVAPRSEADLVPEVSGRVIWIAPSLAPGGFFDAGAPLLRIEKRDYELARDRQRAAVQRAKSERSFRAAELERQEGLSAGGVASRSQLADARRAASVAEANLLDARAALEQAERDLARTEIRAPFEGRVRDEQVDVGQFVNRGTAVARIYATDYAEIRLPIADDQLAFLDLRRSYSAAPRAAVSFAEQSSAQSPDSSLAPSPELLTERVEGGGPRVRLSATFAGQSSEWTGHVVRTEGTIDPRSRMVNIVARVEDPYGASEGSAGVPLAVGLFVKAEIEGPVVENVVVVPRYAMRENSQVLVVDENDRLRHRRVDVLRIDRDDVLVQGPLGAGERICVSPLQIVVEGMHVRPVQERAALDIDGLADPS